MRSEAEASGVHPRLAESSFSFLMTVRRESPFLCAITSSRNSRCRGRNADPVSSRQIPADRAQGGLCISRPLPAGHHLGASPGSFSHAAWGPGSPKGFLPGRGANRPAEGVVARRRRQRWPGFGTGSGTGAGLKSSSSPSPRSPPQETRRKIPGLGSGSGLGRKAESA